ncbi:polyribonucleotide nucleotidyltransferase [Candidatus Dojkabacteria bacterium]|uniref:Polyribonucleotide nucleotidyltransferase n=1 Tax=Candidatus Dojkabacteria bacterium TaxID=2099670 RepID=A0A955L262_9BACT|nr:polyribonucleotide nucleotidyltransferase [Candidatus Dojkabacteria bacterium]
MKEVSKTISVAKKDVEIATGKLATLSHGAIKLTMGGTVLFAAVTVDNSDSDLDYFPLSVEYIEKMYASGNISGSRFKKREGLPSDEATIKAREVDHSIRSLFPKSFKRAVSVVLTVLAYDGENDPQALTVLGTSLAIMQAGIPFAGPCSSVVVGVNPDNTFTINPSAEGREDLAGEFIISGVDGKTLSFEGWGKELTEDTMDKLLDAADKEIRSINKQQTEFIKTIDKTLDLDPNLYDNKPADEKLIDLVKKSFKDQIKEAMFVGEKDKRDEKLGHIQEEARVKFLEEDEEIDANELSAAVDYVARAVLREGVMEKNERVSGRKLDEIRPLSASIDELPTVHGSAVFTRGLTQSLSIVTLAPKSSELLFDDMEGEGAKTFMHHYNFPPFSTGEAGRYRYHPGRREIGHGAIGENALMNMVPSTDDFPYTIRVVSEIMSSNGSTSMAATCASSMALMAAGVPMKEQVAGIGVGLVTEDGNPENYKLLLDIEGIEDFYGDMDFKVAGTEEGITALQMDVKITGITMEILADAIKAAHAGRIHILNKMLEVIDQPRAELNKYAPRISTIKINPKKIGELIGPGGKIIRALQEETNTEISVEEDGTVHIAGVDPEGLERALEQVELLTKEVEVGQVYTGEVVRIMDFGAFVELIPGKDGLIHISELAPGFVKSVRDVVKEGDMVEVKVIEIDDQGRVNLSRKALMGEQRAEEQHGGSDSE